MHVSTSWLRAYHLRLTGSAAEHMARLSAAGLAEPWDDPSKEFYDISALLAGSFATGESSEVTLRDVPEDSEEAPRNGRLALLIHSSGFIVQRLTLAAQTDLPDDASAAAELAALERFPWTPDQHRWTLGGHPFTGTLRGLLNLSFLAIADALQERPIDWPSYSGTAEDTSLGNQHIRRLADAGLLSHPFPVSFGTHFEFEYDELPPRQDLEHITDAVLFAARGHQAWADRGLVDANALAPWYFFENQSIVHRRRSELAGRTPDRPSDNLQLLEFLTLRRAALRSVQRDSQRVLTEGAAVSKRRIEEWHYLVSTNTDDYVLHDRMSSLILPLHEHMATSPLVRDPSALEEQVRSNVDSFSARIEGAGQSASAVIGALFAVVASMAGIAALLKVGVAAWTGVPAGDLAATRPWLNGFIDTSLMITSFGLAWFALRRLGQRLPRRTPYGPQPARHGRVGRRSTRH